MDGEHPGAFGTAAEMDTGHIAQSSIQWAHHCPALCRQGRPNFLGQLSSCQLPTPFQHGGGGRHPTVGTKREPRCAPTRAVWSSLHGSKAGPSGLHWRRTQLQDMVHPAPHTKTGGSHPGARAHSRDTLGLDLDDDSILILRQMYITSLRAAVSLPGPRSFLEHPEDPVVSSSLPKAKECSSFWITEEGQLWMEENSLTAISFDQCRLGQLVKKATTLATDLPIQDWDQMRSHMWAPTSPRLLADTLGIGWQAWPKPSLCHSQRRGTSGSPHNLRETLRNHLSFPPGKTGTQSGRRSLLITPGLKARRQECPEAPPARANPP